MSFYHFRSSRIVFFAVFLVFLFLFNSSYSPAFTVQGKTASDLKKDGVELYHNGSYVQAIGIFKQIEGKTQDKFILAQAYVYLAMSYYCLEEKEEAAKWLNKSLETNPKINEADLLFPPGFDTMYLKAKDEAAGKPVLAKAPSADIKTPVVKTVAKTSEKKKKKSPLLLIVGGLAAAGGLTIALMGKKTPKVTTGSIQITSTPTGAKVYLDGSDTGKTTNCTLSDVSPGSHPIKLVLDGYIDYIGSANVTGGQTVTVNAPLTPNTISIDSPTATSVWIKGQTVEIKWGVTAVSAGQTHAAVSSLMDQPALTQQRLLAQQLGALRIREGAAEKASGGRAKESSARAREGGFKEGVSRDLGGNILNRDITLVQAKVESQAGAAGTLALTPSQQGASPLSVLDPLRRGQATVTSSASTLLYIAKVKIDLYNGTTLIAPPIATEAPSGTTGGTFSWTIPNDLADGANYKVRISCASASNVFKDSAAFMITGAPALSMTPAGGLTSTGKVGGPFSPSVVDYVLQNTGGVALNWTAAKTQTWMTLSAASGTLAAGATVTVTLSINSNANVLTVGTYGDTVSFTNTTNGIGNTTRPVSLTVAGLPALNVIPENRDVVYTAGTTTFAVTNTGTGTMTWTAAVTSGTWLTIQSGSSGTDNGQITAAFQANPGATTRTGTIRVTAGGGALGSPKDVTVTQAGAPALSVTPAGGLTSFGKQGGPFSPSSISYNLQNTGGTALNWTAVRTQAWTTLSLASGALAPGTTATVTVSINSNADPLVPATYTDTVSFANTTNGLGNTTRPVSLTVLNAPDYVVSSLSGNVGTASISFSATVSNIGNVAVLKTISKLRMTLRNSTGTIATIDYDINPLAAGASQTVTQTFSVPGLPPGVQLSLSALADATDVINEVNETNNSKAIKIF